MTYDPAWRSRAVSAAELIAHVTDGQRLFVHGAAATPTPLLDALVARSELSDVRLYHLHLGGPCRFADPDCAPGVVSNSLFTGSSLRAAVAEGRAEFVPVFYVATEHGVANLHGLNLRERAEVLIAIAHPDFRKELWNEVCALRHFDFRPAKA